MEDIVRLKGVTIKNFKNVNYGHISFEANDFNSSSILGLYGQNGSGKTALINALSLLRVVLSGQQVSPEYCDYINCHSKESFFEFEFLIKTGLGNYEATYSFVLTRGENTLNQNIDSNNNLPLNVYAQINKEVIRFSFDSETVKYRLSTLLDTDTEDVFLPQTKYKVLLGTNQKLATDMLVNKKITRTTSRSFVFSLEFLSAVRNRANDNTTNEFRVLHELLESFVNYGNYQLFVIDTKNSGIISLNTLPLAFKYINNNQKAIGSMVLPLDGVLPVPKDQLSIVKNIINAMNVALTQIIPGLTIGVTELGEQLLPNNQVGINIQLIAHRNNDTIPLKYESEGIKKIISILQLLIFAFNYPSITVAIDELDSGIFEYLLGELLRIIAIQGKGQLIFTSHNLRPLETLNKKYIAFTTTNPNNRYIKLKNVKSTNNLRDFYYRDILLGEQDEEVYQFTNNSEIALAFKEAGEISGT